VDIGGGFSLHSGFSSLRVGVAIQAPRLSRLALCHFVTVTRLRFPFLPSLYSLFRLRAGLVSSPADLFCYCCGYMLLQIPLGHSAFVPRGSEPVFGDRIVGFAVHFFGKSSSSLVDLVSSSPSQHVGCGIGSDLSSS